MNSLGVASPYRSAEIAPVLGIPRGENGHVY